ncbi:serine/threonine-protein kinase [Luteimonas sp. RD2P54]|uniref:Serine/threonine-protein kinase n=1 Tax=Luteimonas endophytica TaxID=3042023 RepID=A0ABT6JDK7_9GAMM|nr:serine/threonine-protein kinase [Luteimonas endophytica]MDH5824809.1 serine/threonine-protein kinase [Luteimonas endophytica]
MSARGGDPRVRVDALFERALELEGTARLAFLDRETAGDPGLRAELDELLRLVDAPAPQLEPPALADGPLWRALADGQERTDRPAPGADSGRRIGAWLLLRELGRGGMGTVYLAERVGGGFEQRAALKLIRPGVDSAEFLQRFAQERQILASLEHPGIARLLDGGRDERGMPWLAMEYVEGLPLDRYCDEARLDIDARLALFVRIGQAVAYAHRHLIVHRDLKPSNIVVTAAGEVKLLDFGIAKVLSGSAAAADEPLTRTAARMFTPEYATPEQVTGAPATTATDVYQLGLLLYELLTGQRAQPLAGDSLIALERSVCHGEPTRPSLRVAEGDPAACAARRSTPQALRRALRGDLDNIVCKALRKAPERRYATAAALVEDIGRWRQGRPVRARPETFGYRTGKFVRRHPFGVAGAAAVLLLLAAYAVTVTLQAGTIARERDRARAEAARAQQVQALVLRLFQGADPEASGGAQLSARELLDRGWEGIEAELGDHPQVQAELLGTVGEAYRQLGLYDRAGPLFDRALEAAGTVAGDDPRLLARALRNSGRLHIDRGDYPQAGMLLRDALARFQSAAPPPHPDIADTLDDLGQAAFRAGDHDAALELHRDALAMRRRLFGEVHVDIAQSLDRMGVIARHRSDYAAAEPLLGEALALRRRLLPPTHPQLAASLSNLALARTDLGDYDGAGALYEEALELATRVYGDSHPQVARVLNNQARLLHTRGDLDGAVALLRRSLEMRRGALGERHPAVAQNLNDLGLALTESGDLDAAEPYYRQALEAYEPEHPWRAATVFNLGWLAELRGDYAGAETHYRAALERQRIDYGDAHDRVGTDLFRLGVVLHRQGRLDEAETHLRQALEIYRERLPAGHQRLALVLLPLGELLVDRGDRAAALPLLREAWRLRRDTFGEADPRTIAAADALARAGEPR